MGPVLVINPGGSSTKIALYDGDRCLFRRSVSHDRTLATFESLLANRDQLERAILEALASEGFDAPALEAVVGRGGALKPLASGTYRVGEALAEDIKHGRFQAKHASNLGSLLAYEIGRRLGKPAFMVDPVSVDEFIPEARLSGLPGMDRRCLDHPLNSKMVARKAALELGKAYNEINLIVAHLGTGITVGAHRRGQMIDVSNANDGGPFSTQRTGSLPTTQVVDLCYSGTFTRDEMYLHLTTRGGLKAYLGTDDLPEAVRRAEAGDDQARLVIGAMAYQIAKEIGASAACLAGDVDAVVFTGGMAYSSYLVDRVKQRVAFLTPNVFVYPGEHEMEALAQGALRVLKGEEQAREYR